MPIVNMTTRPEQEARAEMEAMGGKNFRPYKETSDGPVSCWLYDTHQGLCLEDRERNYHDDSDFYMLVWDPETQTIKEIEYATTRFWTYPCYGSSADATPEVKAAAAEYRRKQALEKARLQNQAAAKAVKIGRRVRVVSGRKVSKGTEGQVFWIGPDKYMSSRYSYHPVYRIGIKADDGQVYWTAARNVEVVNPEQYLIPDAQLVEQFKCYIPGTFASPMSGLAFIP